MNKTFLLQLDEEFPLLVFQHSALDASTQISECNSSMATFDLSTYILNTKTSHVYIPIPTSLVSSSTVQVVMNDAERRAKLTSIPVINRVSLVS
mmetsp:Transcript_10533/g.21226  ORF Transcript_10533/g.21226 Transcript_10533/m.21226 type:complete len:94 (-) Transcript_10533:431-712(-)